MEIQKNISKVAAAILLAVVLLFPSCDGMMDNPLKDKETGEDINLLLIDFNFFKTQITCNLYDANTKELVGQPATIKFSGKNGNDIVTFSGEKRTEFLTTNGQFELTVDPNVQVSASSPLLFAMNVDINGYVPMSKGVSFSSDGKKNIDFYLTKKTDQTQSDIGGGIDINNGDTVIVFGYAPPSRLKSAKVEELPYKISWSVSVNDFLKFKDAQGNFLYTSSEALLAAYNANPEGFMYIKSNSTNNFSPWPDLLNKDGSVKSVILHILESGTLEYIMVGGVRVADFNGAEMKATATYTGTNTPDVFGFARFENNSWNFLGQPIVAKAMPYSYTLIEVFDNTLCQQGATISFNAGFKSSFSITADIYDANGKFILAQNFTGVFPASFVLENVPAVPAKLVFRNNNPAFKPMADLNVASLCSGNYAATVEAQQGYTGYQFVLKAFCADNPQVAFAPTYKGEYRIKNTNDPWQGGFMTGGVIDLLGKPEQEYEYRLLWENQWETTTFHSRFNADGSYPYPSDSNIKSEKMDDGRIRINISHVFKTSVCEKMNW